MVTVAMREMEVSVTQAVIRKAVAGKAAREIEAAAKMAIKESKVVVVTVL